MGSHGARSVMPSLGNPKRLCNRVLALCESRNQGLHVLALLLHLLLNTAYIPAPGWRGRRWGRRRGEHLPGLVVIVLRPITVTLVMYGSLPGWVRDIAVCVAVCGSLPCAITITVVSISVIYPL